MITLKYLIKITEKFKMSPTKGKGKGKGVDWKATAEMLSSTSNTHPSQDEEADSHTAAEAVEAILTTTPDDLQSLDGLQTPARQEALKEFDTIKLIYDLDEMKVAKANHLRFSTPRSAPPPPYRAIAPKPKPAKGFLDTSYEVAGEGKDMEMADFNEGDELTEGWHTTIQRSLRRMKTADSASLRVLTSTPEPEHIVLERWECHEASYRVGSPMRSRASC
jgi:hypothetical protein